MTSPDFIFLRGVLVWGCLQALVYSVTVLLTREGIPLHSSSLGFSVLVLRDAFFSALGLFLWSRTRHGAQFLKDRSIFPRMDSLGIISAALLLLLYYFTLLLLGEASDDSSLMFAQRTWKTPLRLFFFILMQQVLSVGYLLDLCRDRFGSRTGVFYCSAIFSLSHLGAAAWSTPLLALLLTGITFPTMLGWSLLRARFNSKYLPFCIHFGFYIIIILMRPFF